MDKYFGQRRPLEGQFKPTSFNEIAKHRASLQSGCDHFFQEYIKSILKVGELSSDCMQCKSISPGEIIKEIIAQNLLIKTNRVGLINLSKDKILVDANQLKFAFSKIIENAIQYNEDKHHTTVQIENSGDDLLVTIKDRGIGIDPHEKSRIFQPFFRGSDSMKFSNGLGLGLTLSREILHHHDSEIRVESEGRGLGTSVYISFPFEQKKVLISDHETRSATRSTTRLQRLAY